MITCVIGQPALICPSLGVWLRDGSLLPMVSKEIVHSGERTCPAQALSLPATGSGLLSSGDIYLVLLPSVVVASMNQVIQNALRKLWEIVPAPATALPDLDELHAPVAFRSGGVCYPENSRVAPRTDRRNAGLIYHQAILVRQGHWVQTQQGCSHHARGHHARLYS